MRQISYDPLTGLMQHMGTDADGNVVLKTSYDKNMTKAVLDQNARLKGQGMGNELRLAGSIPFEVIQHWKQEYGVDIFNPEHKEKAKRLYNSSDFSKVRINDFKL